MADYYPLIARAVTGLDKATGEARRALYERARTALVTQLRGVQPALTEADITRERLALEEAIRKVEAEAARRPPQPTVEWPRANLTPQRPASDKLAPAPQPPSPPQEIKSGETPPDDEVRRALDDLAPSPQPESGEAPDREAAVPDGDEVRSEFDALAPSPQPESREAPDGETVAPAEPPPQPSGDEPSLPFEPDSRPDQAAPPQPGPRSAAVPP